MSGLILNSFVRLLCALFSSLRLTTAMSSSTFMLSLPRCSFSSSIKMRKCFASARQMSPKLSAINLSKSVSMDSSVPSCCWGCSCFRTIFENFVYRFKYRRYGMEVIWQCYFGKGEDRFLCMEIFFYI